MSHVLRASRFGLLLGACIAAGAASAQEVRSFNVAADGRIGPNQLGIEQGTPLGIDFMLDPDLSPTRALSSEQVLRFIDPWRWHWRLWDWLRVFVIEQPRLPIPRPDPPWTIRAVFDDAQDMVMNMPGVPPMPRGTEFVTMLRVLPDAPFLRENRLPTMTEFAKFLVPEGSRFEVLDPEGKMVLEATLDQLKVTPSEPPCQGDTDHDGDVDGTDAAALRRDFGRTDCPVM